MKKFAVLTLAVVLVGAVSIGAFAYRGGMSNMMPQNQQNQMYGPRSGMRGGMGMMDPTTQTPMQGMRGRMRGGMTCPCYDGSQAQPGQAPWAAQMITEEKATAAANEFVAKYFPEYTVKTVEKDDWRPMYFATIEGPNGVEQVMTIHGLGGQVMHVFPKIVEEPAAE